MDFDFFKYFMNASFHIFTAYLIQPLQINFLYESEGHICAKLLSNVIKTCVVMDDILYNCYQKTTIQNFATRVII